MVSEMKWSRNHLLNTLLCLGDPSTMLRVTDCLFFQTSYQIYALYLIIKNNIYINN